VVRRLQPSLRTESLIAAFGTVAGTLFVELTVVAMFFMFSALFIFPILLVHTWWAPLAAVISFIIGMIAYPRIRRYARYAAAIALVVIAVLGVWIASSSVPPQSCAI
jgi:hypothetical protein